MNEKINEVLNKKKFLLITHTFATGPIQELKEYFIKNKATFSFIEHPLSYNKNQKQSQITFFEKGKEKKYLKGIKIKGPDILHFIKDFFYTIYFVVKTKEKYDICISADGLNSFSAWCLKKLGFIDKLVYWTIDYTPERFENSLLNKIYHWIDRFCCYHVNLLWNSSSRMKFARKNNGVDIQKCAEEIVVPDGCHFQEIKRPPPEKVNRFKLVFMGHLVKGKGVDLVINSLPDLVKEYPQVTLTIVGTGSEEENLKNLVRKLDIENKVVFTGFIKEHKDLEEIIASCGVAIAPYVPDPNSYTFFSDVGKVKIYLACGLPILITDVPEIAQEIHKRKVGLIFEYTKDSFIENIEKLLNNEDTYFQYRRNAIEFVRDLSWDNIFYKVMDESFKKLL